MHCYEILGRKSDRSRCRSLPDDAEVEATAELWKHLGIDSETVIGRDLLKLDFRSEYFVFLFTC